MRRIKKKKNRNRNFSSSNKIELKKLLQCQMIHTL